MTSSAMRDPVWQETFLHVYSLLHSDDVVLAPHGDWPAFPCAARFYEDLIDTDGATVVILHKGRMSGTRKSQLAALARHGRRAFANEVFAAFFVSGRKIAGAPRAMKRHYAPVDRFLRTAAPSNWDSMPPQPPCMMEDRAWRETYQYIHALLRADDTVLAPQGDWPPFPCAARFYEDLIDTQGATVVFLHKGRMSGARKSQLVALARHGKRIFANDVFAVFSVSPKALAAPDTMSRHYAPVDEFLLSAPASNWESMPPPPPCTMQDRAWQESYLYVYPLLRADDLVLAPKGNWPAFPCTVRFYEDLIDTDGATVVFFHKGRMSGTRRSQLADLARHGQCVFANEVFAVFSVAGRIAAAPATMSRHCAPVDRFLRSAPLSNWDSMPAPPPCTMQDRSWREAYQYIYSLLRTDDVVLAPEGDWPAFPCVARFYEDLIDTDGATVVFLHKGRMSGAKRGQLAELAGHARRVFANDVFAVFSVSPKAVAAPDTMSRHYTPVDLFLRSSQPSNWDSMPAPPPCTMQDRAWREAYLYVYSLLRQDDSVLAPSGDWPPFPCAARFYEDLIDTTGATVVFLHKGRMSGTRRSQLAELARHGQRVFANDVFAVFSVSAKASAAAAPETMSRHYAPVDRFLRSAPLSNWDSMPLPPPCTMQDQSWRETYQYVHALLRPDDTVLAPRGDWPVFPCVVRFYEDLIDSDGATVVFLHKGRMSGARKSQLTALTLHGRRIFANDVFAVFSLSPNADAAPDTMSRHYAPVDRFLRSAPPSNWDSMPLPPPCAMQDRSWREAYQYVYALLRADDTVLAPCGDWPDFPCAVRFYEDLIDTDGATVVFLHKGRVSGANKSQLAELARRGQRVFANDVFAVFNVSAKVLAAPETMSRHYQPVDQFLQSSSLRKRKSKIIYIHVPKAGGTSMWAALSTLFPSHIYYSSPDACLRYPPAGDEYDLVGIHFSPSVIASFISPDDWVIGMVRDPTQRLLSSILHCRRPGEDPTTFSPAQRAMREMSISEFLKTDAGRFELQLQLVIFGTDYRKAFQSYSDAQMLDAAFDYANRDNVILAPSERSDQFAEFLINKLSLPRFSLEKVNENNRTLMSASIAEFESLKSQIDAMNVYEKKLHDFVVSSFNIRMSEVLKTVDEKLPDPMPSCNC